MWQQCDIVPTGGEVLSCLRAAVDIKRKHDEVKTKFSVGPFQLKNDEVRQKHCVSTTRERPQWCTTWTTYVWLTSVHPPLNLPSPLSVHWGAAMHNGNNVFSIRSLLFDVIVFWNCFYSIVFKYVVTSEARTRLLLCYERCTSFLFKWNKWTLTALSKRIVAGLELLLEIKI